MNPVFRHKRLINMVLPLLAMWVSLQTGVADAAADALDDAEKLRRVLTMYAAYRKHFPQVDDMDAKAAMALLDRPDVVFVDVRQMNEQAVSMIPGAVPENRIMQNPGRYRDRHIIAYCTIGYRSGQFADRLRKKGFRITNLKAGLLGWVHAGGSLVQQGRAVRKLHVYGRKWDLAPASIHTVY